MIAELAITTGQAPGELLAVDARLFDEIASAAERRWTTTDELLARLLEVAHALLRSYLAVHTAKGTKLPEPLVVPRPGVEPPKPTRVRPSEFAASFASRRARPRA